MEESYTIIAKRFKDVPIHKISVMLWDVLAKTHEPYKLDGQDTILFHGLRLVKNDAEMVTVYDTSGERQTVVKNVFILYVVFDMVFKMEVPEIAIIPKKFWAHKHPKPSPPKKNNN